MVVDVPLFHLDRPFTYRLPESLRGAVRLGSRVKVPFGGRKRVDGWVVGFSDELPPGARDVIRLVSPLPAFGARELALLRWVADRWAGTLADVLRLAVPQRVAAVEAAGGLKSEALTHAAGGHAGPSGSPPVNRGSGGRKSEAGTTVAGGHAEPSGSPPVDKASRGRKSEAPTLVVGGPLAPSGSPPVDHDGGAPPGDPLAALVGRGWRGAVLWRPLPGEDRGTRVVAMVEAALAAGRGALVITPGPLPAQGGTSPGSSTSRSSRHTGVPPRWRPSSSATWPAVRSRGMPGCAGPRRGTRT